MTGRATHGHTRRPAATSRTTREFNSWLAMRQRCYYTRSPKFRRYGGRGITVCDRWRHSFQNFLADMGPRPLGKTIGRRDNDGPYSPRNCRWETPKQQTENRTKESFDSRSHWTHCKHGHPYSSENTRRTKGGTRKCRACERRQAQDRRDRFKALGLKIPRKR